MEDETPIIVPCTKKVANTYIIILCAGAYLVCFWGALLSGWLVVHHIAQAGPWVLGQGKGLGSPQ